MTINLSKGANAIVSASGHDAIIVRLVWQVPEHYELDASAFMLNANGAVPNDEAMIFFNQPVSPDGAVHYHNEKQLFTLDLKKLNPAIQKIAFTLTIYEGIERKQAFKNLTHASIQVFKDKEELVQYDLSGQELSQETALIFAELYLNKGQWKFRAIGQGFNGGLAALCGHFGVSVDEAPQQTTTTPVPPPAAAENKTAPAPSKMVSLEKKLKDKPALLSLAKQAHVSLEKVKLTEHRAKVAICLDISGSMYNLYQTGKIQRLAEKVLALGCQFDDDGMIDVFLFGERAYHAEEMGINNFPGFTQRLLQQYPLEGGTCYGKVMKMIRNYYFPANISADKPLVTKADLPVYVMFVTDGNTTDQDETKRQVKGSSYEPLFWQFMAIGKTKKSAKKSGFFANLLASDFSFLEALDVLPERYIDNANFFSVEDPEEVSDAELYDLLMAEYPNWLKLAKEKQMLA
jgi:stress response protein SCP2